LSALLFDTLGSIVNRVGSPFLIVYRPDFDYDFGRFPQYRSFYGYWKTGRAVNNGGDVTRLYLLHLNISQVLREGVAGDFVEVGVFKGNSAKILHEFSHGAKRNLFLFDTFTGFDKADLTGIDARFRPSQYANISFEAVREFIGTEGTIFITGVFPASCEKIDLPAQVAVLHVDCDLYAPTKAALEMFYPRMPSGALIILHDYDSGHWPGATRAIDEFFADKPESIVVMPDKCGTAVARRI
jgi:Macrocin-O-methyltransferase (TylF)